MSTASKAPTGLTITRNGGSYTFSWKIGDADYGNGQQLKYHVNGVWTTAFSNKHTNTTSYTITPGQVRSVGFMVRGNRKSYTKKKRTINPTWSAWASASWEATVPSTPQLTYTRNSVTSGTFAWSVANDAAGTNIFTKVVCETWVGTALTGWQAASGSAASGSNTYNESLGGGNVIRWFRVKAIGIGGLESGWVTAAHAYGLPTAARLLSASVTPGNSVSSLVAKWEAPSPALAPVDTVEVQYAIDVPTDVNFAAPSSGWTDAIKVTGNGSGDKIVIPISDVPGPDECVWVRIQTTHDEDNHNWSAPVLAYIGTLQTPEIEATPDPTTGDVLINIEENTSCTVACTAIYYRSEKNPEEELPVAVLPNGTTSITINIPEIASTDPDPVSTTCFGAYAFVGSYDGTAVTARMTSGKAEDSDLVSRPPAWLELTNGSQNNSVRITWPWTWKDATAAELAWADHDDAWESTAQPEFYKIENNRVESWVIAGLEMGKRWFFQVRLLYEGDDENVTGPWSEQYSFDLSSIPDRPALTLSRDVINEGGAVTARWGYTSEDGTSQQYADICFATISDQGVVSYGDIIAHVDAGQSVEITYDWQTDETYYMCVRTTSTSGRQSEWSEPASLFVAPPIEISVTDIRLLLGFTATDWKTDQISIIQVFEQDATVTAFNIGMVAVTSLALNQTTLDPDTYSLNPISGIITFAQPLTVHTNDELMMNGYVKTGQSESVSSTALITAENLEKYKSGNAFMISKGMIVEYWWREVKTVRFELKALPMFATVTGAGNNGTTTMAIIRAEDYHVYRPDDSETDGYAGEQIVAKSQIGEGEISISQDDLIGYLDDGAKYVARFTVQDEYGQSASVDYPFTVNWTQQAGIPTATAKADIYQRIMMITPKAPAGYASGDVCDIYRITLDKPELIVRGGEFGTTYVDPYPGFGDVCGHRVVTRTANGDYITADNKLAWCNLDEDDGDILEDQSMVIDVNGDQIELPYNLEFSNAWKKDFQRTAYLGGSIQGDWNPAVTRDMSANTVIIAGPDVDRQLSMRGLAGYAGPAHVRTPDGSSFACDIQVRESMDYKSSKVSYSLTIQVIDPQAPEGMTLEEWQAMHPVS